MSIKGLSIAVLASLAVSCGGGDSDPNFDGSYSLAAVSTTTFDVNGGQCGDASGAVLIEDSQMSGSVLTTNGTVFDVSGSITSAGSVTGGFAQSGQNAVTFDGSVSGNQGSGTWTDIFECTGTWTLTKNP